MGQFEITEVNLAGGWLYQAIYATDQGALAGTRGTDKSHYLAPGNFNVNVLEREISRLILLFQVFESKHLTIPMNDHFAAGSNFREQGSKPGHENDFVARCIALANTTYSRN